MAKRKSESMESKIARQDWELRTRWRNEWFRQAAKKSEEWRAKNPPPEMKDVQSSALLPDGTSLQVDWEELRRKFGL